MESQEQIDNANLLLTKHRLKLEWNQMVWSVNNLRCGTAATEVNSTSDDANTHALRGYPSASRRIAYREQKKQLDGAEGETRTLDPLITNEVLYQLSYFGAIKLSHQRA